MKILHTADWHIGKILHRQSLYDDISYFFDWLVQRITDEKIDLLLVSGDIFDLTNPSNMDTKLYYQTLYRLSKTNVKVIITGGNHDSISLLDAPSSLLDVLDITVVGGAKDDIHNEIIPITGNHGEVECIVLAVPFLRDKDLRQSFQASEMADKSSVISEAIKQHYDTLVEITIEKFGHSLPIIAMGHLYMKGSITSDSEREIHIGNLEGLDSQIIHSDIDYLALGHIHKPQKIGNKNNFRYSGSPVFLDFSERDYDKMVIEIEINENKITSVSPVAIPKSRDLLKISGDLPTVNSLLLAYQNKYPLTAFIEIEVKEKQFDVLKIQALENMVETVKSEHFRILKNRIIFENTTDTIQSIPDNDKTIDDLSPLDIFRQRLAESEIDPVLTSELTNIYVSLMEELND
ncbi:MAG: exonuclease SbcCD subunit D C-terminal domain-containing protein [Saprospiraceae bacterium]